MLVLFAVPAVVISSALISSDFTRSLVNQVCGWVVSWVRFRSSLDYQYLNKSQRRRWVIGHQMISPGLCVIVNLLGLRLCTV